MLGWLEHAGQFLEYKLVNAGRHYIDTVSPPFLLLQISKSSPGELCVYPDEIALGNGKPVLPWRQHLASRSLA